MNFQSKKGEIATVLTIAAFVVVTISSLASSFFISKNKQTLSTQATEVSGCPNPADDTKWYCAGECASQPVRDLFNGTYPADGSDEWRNEKAANCNISSSQCQATKSCSVASPTPACVVPDEMNVVGACDPACCKYDNQCPSGQKCLNPNGYCQSGSSCAVVNPTIGQPQFIRKCAGTNNATCAWVGCSQTEIDAGDCSIDTNNPKPQSLKCTSNTQCGATPTVTPYKSPTPTTKPGATNTPTPSSGCANRDQSCGFAGNQSKQCCSSSDECKTTGFTNMTCVAKSSTLTNTPTPRPNCWSDGTQCNTANSGNCCTPNVCTFWRVGNTSTQRCGNDPNGIAPTNTPTPRPNCWSDGTQCSASSAGNCCSTNVCTFWRVGNTSTQRCGNDPNGTAPTNTPTPSPTVAQTTTITIEAGGTYNVDAQIADKLVMTVRDYNNASSTPQEKPEINPKNDQTYSNQFTVSKIETSYEVKVRLKLKSGEEVNPTSLDCAGWLEKDNNCYVKVINQPTTVKANFQVGGAVATQTPTPGLLEEEKAIITAGCAIYNNSDVLIQGKAHYGLSDNNSSLNNSLYEFSYSVDPGQTYYYLSLAKLEKYMGATGLADIKKNVEYDFSCWARNFSSSEVISKTVKVKGGGEVFISLESKSAQPQNLNQKNINTNISTYLESCGPEFFLEEYLFDGYPKQPVFINARQRNITDTLVIPKPADDNIYLEFVVKVRNTSQSGFIALMTDIFNLKYSEMPDNYKWNANLKYNCDKSIESVWMRGDKYEPSLATVQIGKPILWRNGEPFGGKSYTVTSGSGGVPNGMFSSGTTPIGPGEIFMLETSALGAGSYQYFSVTNPAMIGQVNISP